MYTTCGLAIELEITKYDIDVRKNVKSASRNIIGLN